MKTPLATGAAALAALALGTHAIAATSPHRPSRPQNSTAASPADTIRVSRLSQQYGPHAAGVSVSISVQHSEPGRNGGPRAGAAAVSETTNTGSGHPASASGDSRSQQEPLYPTLRTDSPLLRNPQPYGPGSFWYTDGAGHACPYLANSVGPCYTVVAPAASATPAAPAVDPAAVAASLAAHLALTPGRINASPRAAGLTGARSWFWLDPAPQTEVLSVTLAGERVTVTAEPSVQWRFGDGSSIDGSAGVAYAPGTPSPAAITHVYETRCLPGDRGRNPYVVASCGGDGYHVEALVGWRISYAATGPIDTTGLLQARTTETGISYPVSEARAFLTGGGNQ